MKTPHYGNVIAKRRFGDVSVTITEYEDDTVSFEIWTKGKLLVRKSGLSTADAAIEIGAAFFDAGGEEVPIPWIA